MPLYTQQGSTQLGQSALGGATEVLGGAVLGVPYSEHPGTTSEVIPQGAVATGVSGGVEVSVSGGVTGATASSTPTRDNPTDSPGTQGSTAVPTDAQLTEGLTNVVDQTQSTATGTVGLIDHNTGGDVTDAFASPLTSSETVTFLATVKQANASPVVPSVSLITIGATPQGATATPTEGKIGNTGRDKKVVASPLTAGATVASDITGRDLPADFISELEKENRHPIYFVKAEFDSGTKRWATVADNLTWNGHTWTGRGKVQSVGRVEETEGVTASRFEVTLDGSDDDLLDIALSKPYTGRSITAWLGLIDESRNLVATPENVFEGTIDQMIPQENSSEAVIRLSSQSEVADLQRSRTLRYSHEDQQSLWPNDKGLEYVGDLQGRSIPWGKEAIQIPDRLEEREIVYGKWRKGGPIVFAHSTNNGEDLHLVVPLASHSCKAIDKIFLDKREVSLDSNGNATGVFSGNLRIKKHLGSDNQSADSDLVSESSNWTTDHRLRGITYIYVKMTYNASLYPSGVPDIEALMRGKDDIRDPRDGTRKYTPNAALCAGDFLETDPLGFGASTDDIDDTALEDSANACEKQMLKKDGTREDRYQVNGVLRTGPKPGTQLEKIREAMAGRIIHSGGSFVIRAGQYFWPNEEYDEGSMAEDGWTLPTKQSQSELFNAVRGSFPWKENGYRSFSIPGRTNSSYESEDGGGRDWGVFDFDLVTRQRQAQHLAKIELERIRLGRRLQNKKFDIVAFKSRVGDVVEVTRSRWSMEKDPFVVKGWRLVPSSSGGPPDYIIEMDLKETSPDLYNWGTADELDIDTPPTTQVPGEGQTEVQVGSVVPGANLEDTLFGDISAQEIRANTGSEWKKVGDVTGENLPKSHATTHEPGGVDQVDDIDIGGTGTLVSSHASRHEAGGSDPLSSLDGLPIGASTADAHSGRHEDGGGDPINAEQLAQIGVVKDKARKQVNELRVEIVNSSQSSPAKGRIYLRGDLS